MASEIYAIIILIHIFVGFLLVYFAAKAYKKTKYLPMLYAALGFLLITIGDTILGDFLIFANISFEDSTARGLGEEIFEISGIVLVIIAVLKS